MSKPKKEEFLRFGQIIRIHGHRCLNEENEERGMIAAKGFTDPDANYMTFTEFRNCKFYRQSLFQILPKGPFEEGSAEEKYEAIISERIGDIVKFGEDVVFKHVDSCSYLSGSVRCSKGGLGAFKVELAEELSVSLVFKMYPFRSFENEGDNIKLESPLRIKNMENRCYISTEKNTGNEEVNESKKKMKHQKQMEMEQKKVTKYNIVTTYSQAYTWLIHLHLQHEKLTAVSQIQTHDLIFLTYTKNQGYLCVQKPKGFENDEKYRIYQPDKYKAIVKLPLEETGLPCYTCLWEIEKQPIPDISPYSDKKKGVDGTYTLRDLLTGEYLKVLPLQKQTINKENTALSLSNLDQKQITIKSAKGLTNIADFVKDNGLVKITGPKATQAIKGSGEIDVEDNEGEVRESELTYRQSQPDEKWTAIYKKGDGEHGFRISKISEDSKKEVLFVLSTYEVLEHFSVELQKKLPEFQDTVKAKHLRIIDEVLIKLIAFIKECSISNIEGDNLPNRKKQYIMKDLKICDKLFKILRSMGQMILKQIYKHEKNENDCFKTVFNRAYYLILQIIKNNQITKLYVCEDWLSIILDHAIENEEETVHEALNEILQSNEKVVSKFLINNDCALVHRVINIFTLKPPHEKFLNIFRASCMSDGSPIVANQQPIRNIFFKRLEDEAKFTFVKAKSSMVMSLDVNYDPQKLYLKCCISKDQLKVRTLKEFFDESSKLDLSQTSNYFISYLNLLADICFGRNTESKKYVEEILKPVILEDDGSEKFDALYTLNYILQDKEIEVIPGYKNLLRAVLRLINYAFVESVDLNPILRINRFRNIDMIEMEREEDLKFKKLDKAMNFVKDNLKNFKSFYDEPAIDDREGNQEKKENEKQLEDKIKKERERLQQEKSLEEKELLLTQLMLIKSTLIIGYWSIEDQKQLLPILLKILTNEKLSILHYKDPNEIGVEKTEVKIFKEEAKKYTPTIQKITNCKALACELIEVIFDFRLNNQVTKCLSVYKELKAKSEQQIVKDRSIVINEQLQIENDDSDVIVSSVTDFNEWIPRLHNIFKDEGESSDKEDKNSQIIPLMVELSIHKNPMLFFRSLLILKRSFEFKADILDSFLNLSIYDEASGSYLANEIAVKRAQLGTLEEENQLYAKNENGKNPYANVMNFLSWLSEAIKMDFDLTSEIDYKRFNDIFSHFNERSQIDQFHQRTIKNKDLHSVFIKFISLSRQPLKNYSFQATEALKFVYRFLALLSKGFLEAQTQILSSIPRVKQHIQEQVSLLEDKKESDKRIGHEFAKKRHDCEAIELLSSLFSNNKSILYNELQIEKTCEEICIMVNKISKKNYYKSHLLDFLRSLIYYKDKHLNFNQSKILAKLQDEKKEKILYRIYKNDQVVVNGVTEDYIYELIDSFQTKNSTIIQWLMDPSNESRTKDWCLIGPQLTYFITLFNLFANLVEGRHIVNIGKCRQVHSYEMLMGIVEKCKYCYPLKTTLRNYINQLYYSTPIEEDLCALIIQREVPQIIEDLNMLITILVKKQPINYIITHPIRYVYFQTYIFLYIDQILLSLNYLFVQSDFFRDEVLKEMAAHYSRGYYYLHYFVIRIYERLRWLANYFYNHQYLRGLLNMVTNKIRAQFLDYFKKKELWRVFDRNEENLNPAPKSQEEVSEKREKDQIPPSKLKELGRRSTDLLHKLVKGQLDAFFREKRPKNEKDNNFPLTFTLPYEERVDSKDKNEIQKKDKIFLGLAGKIKELMYPHEKKKENKGEHDRTLKSISSSLWNQRKFKAFISRYMIENCEELFKIDDESRKAYDFQDPFVSFKEYIQIFVEVNSSNPESIRNDIRIFFFRVIYLFITQQRNEFIWKNNELTEDEKNKQMAKEIEYWEKEDWEEINENLEKRQKFLVQSNVAELIITSFINGDDNRLFSAILKFCIAFTLGGFKESQDALYILLKKDEKNEVFMKLQSLITKLGKKIAGRISEKIYKEVVEDQKFVVDSHDLYDYYDHKIKGMVKFHNLSLENNDEKTEELLQIQVFCLIFRFLQLLCECNHIELKHFVRSQINDNGEKKNYSFSVINVATFEIRRLFKVMNEDASEIIVPLLFFLNEVVTIPCLQNQKSLCETTFFEDLCFMASFFEKATYQQDEKRGFNDPKKKQNLNTTYKQCILILLNILQSNEQGIMRELLSKIKPRFLLGIIKRNLLDLKLDKAEDLKNYLEDENTKNPRVDKKISDAMNVMVVLEKLQALPGSEKFVQQKFYYISEVEKDEKPVNLGPLLKLLRDQMLKIEIVSISSGKRQYVYFPNHPILKTLSPTTRDRIMEEVSRSTQREKIKSLLDFKDEIIQEIKFNFVIQKQKLLGIIPFKPTKIQILQEVAFKLGFLINLIWFFSSDIIVEYFEVIYYIPLFVRPILFGLDLTQFLITGLYFYSYCKLKYTLAKYRSANSGEEEKPEPAEPDENPKKEEESIIKKSIMAIISIITSIFMTLLNVLSQSYFGIIWRFDSNFRYITSNLAVSFLGTFVDQTFFLIYVLFYFMEHDTLSNVFNAVVYNVRQLLSVSLLGIVFVYVFCLVFFETYALQMMSSGGDEACDNILTCVLDLYVSGTIGGSVQSFQIVRFATDLIYFIFFGLLFGNIVSGIMIDTFAELRSKRDDMFDDKKNYCYICGRDRGALQKNGENFEEHINEKHFLWNYIYYMYCLEEKHETEHSGLEYEIRKCLNDKDNEEDMINWIPFNTESEEEHAGKIIELREKMERLNELAKEKITAMTQQNQSVEEEDQEELENSPQEEK